MKWRLFVRMLVMSPVCLVFAVVGGVVAGFIAAAFVALLALILGLDVAVAARNAFLILGVPVFFLEFCFRMVRVFHRVEEDDRLREIERRSREP